MAGSLNTENIWRGGGDVREHERMVKVSGGGPRIFSREDIIRISGRIDFKGVWGGGRSWCQVGGREEKVQ